MNVVPRSIVPIRSLAGVLEMDVIQIDRTDMPTPLDKRELGLLINVHLRPPCPTKKEIEAHAEGVLGKESNGKYAGVAVVYWLHDGELRKRVFSVERRS